jgi:hypothetical protein
MTRNERLLRFAALAVTHRAELGVRYSIGPMFGPWTVCSLSRIERDNPATKGNGAKALHALVALADELGVELTLGTLRKALIPYFERFGFVFKADLDNGHGVVMKRPCTERN